MARVSPYISVFPVFLAWLSFVASPASGCNVPVFRYAMERWHAAPYEAVVVHRGALSADQTEAVRALKAASIEGNPHANFAVRTADAAEVDGASGAWWDSLGTPLPALVLLLPRESRPPGATKADAVVWSGALTLENVEKLVDSPARRAIAEALIGGISAVWTLVEDEPGSASLARLLDGELERLERSLELPAGMEEALAGLGGVGPGERSPVELGFSRVSISKSDPAEEVFVAMLLRCEEGLLEFRDKALAIPIYGRGRALYALAGKGIHARNIEDACRFLVGACSCEFKALNPGTDLLIVADWRRALEAGSAVEAQLLAQAIGPAKTEPPASPVEAKAPNNPPPRSSALLRNLPATLGALAVVVFVSAAVVLWRKP